MNPKLINIKNKTTSYFQLSDTIEIIKTNDINIEYQEHFFWKTKINLLYEITNNECYPLISEYNEVFFEKYKLIENNDSDLINLDEIKKCLKQFENNEKCFGKIAYLIFQKNKLPKFVDIDIISRNY